MASNNELTAVKDEGLLQGYRNLARREHSSWWKTNTWWTQALIWIAIVDGLLAAVLLVAPNIEDAQQKAAERTGQPAADVVDANTGLMVFFMMLGMAPAVGTVILGQEAILDEKIKGTAGWLLSKPVSRTAFVLSKVAPNALGILVSMIILPAIVGVLIFQIAGKPIDLPGFAAGCLATYLALLFYLTLTILLSTISNSRGLVIGLPIGLIFGYQLFLGLIPEIVNYTQWGLTVTVGPASTSLAMKLAQGQWTANYLPAILTAVYILAFVFLSIKQFDREEL